LDEVLAAYPAPQSRRQALNVALVTLLDVARQQGTVQRITLGGSFITTKLEPSDVDLVLLTPGIYQLEGEQLFGGAGADLVALDIQFAHDAWDFQQWVGFLSAQRDMTPVGTINLVT
jgi:hypothetical protein